MTAVTSTRRTRAARKPATYAAAGFALAILIVVAGNYHVGPGENGGVGPAIQTAVLCAVLTAALFAFLVPRARRVERTTLTLGVVSVISLVVFWSGVTPVLTAATLAVAARGTTMGRKGTAGQWMAVAATLLATGWTLANSHLF